MIKLVKQKKSYLFAKCTKILIYQMGPAYSSTDAYQVFQVPSVLQQQDLSE